MENSNNQGYAGMLKYLIVGASFVIIVAGMKAAQSILVPFLLSLFIAIIGSPLLFWLRRKGISMWVSLTTVIAIVFFAGVLLVLLIGASLNDFTRSVPFYQARLQEKVLEVMALLERAGMDLPDKQILEYVDPGAVMNFVSNILSGLGNVLTNAFLIFFTVVFILLEAAMFQSKLSSMLERSKEHIDFLGNFSSKINRYMVIKTWLSLATGILVTAWLTVLGVDFAILWGLLAFIFNFVPNIGSIIAAIPAILLAYVQTGPLPAFLALAGYLAINVGIGNILEPRVMGKGLGLSTLIVFLSLVFWGWVLGPVGMLLSVPLTTAMKIAFSSSKETRWIGILMDSNPSPELVAEDKKDLPSEV